MQIKAEARNVRMTSRKARLVLNLIRGKDVKLSMDILRVMHHKAAPIISKVIHSAVANASHNYNITRPLYISTAFINSGSIIKRMDPRARGRSNVIHKKISHITIFVSERSN